MRTLMYVGERSMYGMKLVNMCHGSNESTLEKKYTRRPSAAGTGRWERGRTAVGGDDAEEHDAVRAVALPRSRDRAHDRAVQHVAHQEREAQRQGLVFPWCSDMTSARNPGLPK